MSHHFVPKTRMGRIVNEIEETLIALILGLMTVVTFVNVVLRYLFNSGLIWGLETVSFLFAWLVLLGISYGVKTTSHLGVDAVLNVFGPAGQRLMGIMAALFCVAYAMLLMKGAWDYWANFANLPQTTGRWFPTGFQEMGRTSYRAWYEVNDIPMPGILRFLEPLLNEGEAYEKLPRVVPYVVLPLGAALLLFRFVQATVRIFTGATDRLIVSHEAEDAVEEAAARNTAGG